MRKTIILLLITVLSLNSGARTITGVKSVVGNVPHSLQAAWVIVDSETAAGTEATDLAVTERTKLLVDAAIAAGSSGDDEISTFVIPSSWTEMRFRGIGITDNGTMKHRIYLGTLGNNADCELAYAGYLEWVIGTQTSIYHQITFTSGGTYEPKAGDILTGNTSGETAVVVSVSALTGGSWAAADAAGTITYRSSSGTFTNSETVKTGDAAGAKSNVLTHAASDLIAFEMADAVTKTQGGWIADWDSVSDAANTVAEASLDPMGADFMVVVTDSISADGKLLVKGHIKD